MRDISWKATLGSEWRQYAEILSITEPCDGIIANRAPVAPGT